ncbi:MAG: hypothetical protein GAK29_04153 [Acinetobacter bereziniae]|uniref:Uncharacterized protein n=1 Tax=Acinetobacter bereziniae TaxID=106648 RepID=A0A833PB87_ACIBZ|nr:MAG: hypothetical protein GAK29_04153 [Acinetobacter bereziniae]
MQLTKLNTKYTTLTSISSISKEIDCELCGIFIPNYNVIIVSLYRSPKGDFKIFVDILTKLMEIIDYRKKQIIIDGDCNIYFNTSETNKVQICDFFKTYGMYKLVQFPTRNLAHLDNVFTNIKHGLIFAKPFDNSIGDHNQEILLNVKINVSKPCNKLRIF